MNIKDSYLHSDTPVVKSISVNADKLTYTLADKTESTQTITLPLATTSQNGLLSNVDKGKLNKLNSEYINDVVTYKINPSDNGGRPTFILIAKLIDWKSNQSSNYYIAGRFTAVRDGNMHNTGVYNLVALATSYALPTDWAVTQLLYVDRFSSYGVLQPYIVFYNGYNYLALKKIGSSTPIYFDGIVKNVLPQDEWQELLVEKDQTLPSGMTIVEYPTFNNYSITTNKYYDGNATRTLLHNGNLNFTTSGKDYAVNLRDNNLYVQVPWTDTKNTAGSTNSTSKMYLIGATSQTTNPQTYSNNAVYATNGTLTTSGVGKDGYIAYPKDGYYSSSKNSETGYLCITLPQSWTDTMIKFDVNIFNYLNNTSVTYTISGYMYSPTQQWFNVAACAVGHHQGNLSNLPVIFGHNGTKCVVYIGTATTTWAYPKIAISNITLGWSNTTTEQWSTGWGFSFTTSLGSYNANVQNTYVGYQSQLLQGKKATDFTAKHSWECTINKNTWSRLCQVKYSENHAGASYILNVQEHRTSVVYNYTYLVNTHHDKKGHITLLNNSNFAYSGDSEARLVVDTYGNNYFEFRDGARLSDSWTSATVKCELIPLSTGDITKYTTYTSGSSVPSGYAVATTVLHTGEGIPNIDNYWKDAYNYNASKILNAPSSSLTFNYNNTSEVLLAEATFLTLRAGTTINLSFSGKIRAWAIASGYSSVDGTTYHNQNNKLEFIYYVYVDGVFVGSYRQGQSFQAQVVNSGTSMRVTIKAKLNKSFTTNAWWHCDSPADYYINSANIGIQSIDSITITATASDAGNVLRNSEYVSYKNGFVFSDINSNSLTYCDKNQVIVKRGGICLKLDSSGLTQSSDSGLTWSLITNTESIL